MVSHALLDSRQDSGVKLTSSRLEVDRAFSTNPMSVVSCRSRLKLAKICRSTSETEQQCLQLSGNQKETVAHLSMVKMK